MLDREKLQSAIEQAIFPYSKDSAEEASEGEEGFDPFVLETSSFLTQELIDCEIEIIDEQAEMDDEDLESLPITHILTPHLQQLLSLKDPLAIISNIIQIYTSPPPEPETHEHQRNGPCEVSPSLSK